MLYWAYRTSRRVFLSERFNPALDFSKPRIAVLMFFTRRGISAVFLTIFVTSTVDDT